VAEAPKVESTMPTTEIEGQNRSRDAVQRKRDAHWTRDTPIDWAHLSRFTLNDEALEHEVLALFAMDAPRYLAKMVTARGRKEWIEAAHTLKGSARAVGAWNVAECAEAAESLRLTAGCEHADLADSRGMAEALYKLRLAVHGTVAYIEHLAAAGHLSR
jgi:HPt (histidine-containing phosphotransfer) domain-containing protein